jgi:hypothetical protein
MDQVKPDAVVVTIDSPPGRAASLPARIRARKPEDGGHVAVVAVLRGTTPEPAPEGVNAVLAEPLNPWELCRVISTLLTIG